MKKIKNMIIKENGDSTSPNKEINYTSTKRNEINHPFHPWRRYFARVFDMALYNMTWLSFLVFIFHVNLIGRSSILNLLDSYIAIGMMLFLEPLWLHFFRTTPGKAIFGIRIEDFNGKKLTYRHGFDRTFGVIASGLGFNIPIYNFIRLWKSYNLCIDKKIQPWNESTSYIIKDTKLYRTFLYLVIYIAIFAIFFNMIFTQ
ncbi:MAG: RDD family protein [Bacillota bacterium]|nr:RDD family protein [Bacillota bacterium]